MFDRWSKLDKYLLVKYMDGNVKSEKADVLTFLDGDGGPADNGSNGNIPDRSSSRLQREMEARRGEGQRRNPPGRKIMRQSPSGKSVPTDRTEER
ncbi:MAG: hypothetical protein ACLRMJ_01590 [Alistipes finegoldii]